VAEARLAQAKSAELKSGEAKGPPAAVKPAGIPDHAQAKAATTPPSAIHVEKSAAPADATMKVGLAQQGDGLRLTFPYVTSTAAAVFRRGETLWLVFDSERRLDTAALSADSSQTIRNVAVSKGADGETIVRLKLARPRLIGLAAEGAAWVVTIADNITEPTQPLQVARSIVGRDRSNITIPFQNPQRVHRIVDPDVGDKLLVVTAMGPARGFLKPQDFLELRAIGSTQGIAIQPLADDLAVELAADKVVITRPGGLTLSTSGLSERNNGKVVNPQVFDTQTWGFDREAPYNHRQSELIAKAAASPEQKKRTARIDLVRFYLARGMIPEAMGVLNVTLADERNDDITGTVLHAVTNVLLNRPNEALKDLSSPRVGNQYDAPVWRAMAYARQGKWPEARELFKKSEASIATLPIELQRIVMLDAMRASIETRDFAGAGKVLNDFETIGVPHDVEPSLSLLIGRLNEGLGRKADALTAYRNAADSRDRRAAAQGRLRELVLHTSIGDIEKKDVIDQLESLTATWRGDETEVEGLQILAHLYTEAGRYRDAFHTMRTALLAHPNSELTRKIQDEAAATFDSLFLSGKGDAMPAIEALGLFYDYRELTPIGRRGDEMIRRLADRLVAVDLLGQAAELLQHQVDHRLQGAARAQVATRLATVYLMDHKADRALAALRSTRTSDLSTDLRNQRLLLEARALSDTGRHELALEVIANMKSREAERLRGDILWSAKKWRDAAEQIELFYGDRWKQFAPLTADERVDILRAAIGYAMAEETISLKRFRDKYGAKMAEGPERRAFEVVTAPIGTGGPEFQQIANAMATANTLDAFLRDMKKRYPDQPAAAPAADGKPAAARPSASALPPKAPAGTPKADPTPTGSISRQIMRRARAAR
jgi:tetratricopeptide (TPR) repeat protein